MYSSLDDLAQALIDAHEGGPLVNDVPAALVPQDNAGAFALQDAIISRLGAVGGWKVAAGSGPEPMCSPLPAKRYFSDGAQLDGVKHRFVLVEVEVAVTLGADLTASASPADVEAAIASIHPALEFVGSPFPDRAAQSRNLLNGDLQSNGAVVLGPVVSLPHDALATQATRLLLDDAVAHEVGKGASWDETIAAVVFLAAHADRRGLPLREGQVIITGARALFALAGQRRVDGVLSGVGRVSATLS